MLQDVTMMEGSTAKGNWEYRLTAVWTLRAAPLALSSCNAASAVLENQRVVVVD